MNAFYKMNFPAANERGIKTQKRKQGTPQGAEN